MNYWHAFCIALIQGLTEYLPISSTAHQVLMPPLLGWRDPGLFFDVATNTGTLLAIIIYLRREVVQLLGAWGRSLAGGGMNPDARLAWAVLWGTLPVAVAGLLFHHAVETWLRSPIVIALASIGFGLLLWLADRSAKGGRDEYSVRAWDVVVVGVAQALALIPGTSRSGITMTAGLAQGMTRTAAARFSFLLAIPVSILAGGFDALHLLRATTPVPWAAFGFAALVAFVSGYAVIGLFLRFVERIGYTPFVIYRVLLGVFLLFYFA